MMLICTVRCMLLSKAARFHPKITEAGLPPNPTAPSATAGWFWDNLGTDFRMNLT